MVLTFREASPYHKAMASETRPSPSPVILDLSGLPEPVVRSMKQLLESLRAGIAGRGPSGPAEKPLPLRGRFADLDFSVSEEDIDEAQREAWQEFPLTFPGSGQP
jgi:hypothetical protein